MYGKFRIQCTLEKVKGPEEGNEEGPIIRVSRHEVSSLLGRVLDLLLKTPFKRTLKIKEYLDGHFNNFR